MKVNTSNHAKIDLIRAYHGSGCVIEAFNYDFTEQGNDELGSGFYFSSSEVDAEMYALQSGKVPTMHVVDLHIKSPMRNDCEGKLSLREIKTILMASPVLDEQLEDFGDICYFGRDKILAKAISSYSGDGELLRTFNCMANDFFPGEIAALNKAIHDVTGYDGVIREFDNGITHYVAWFPEQITIKEIKPVHRDEAAPAQRKPKL